MTESEAVGLAARQRDDRLDIAEIAHRVLQRTAKSNPEVVLGLGVRIPREVDARAVLILVREDLDGIAVRQCPARMWGGQPIVAAEREPDCDRNEEAQDDEA